MGQAMGQGLQLQRWRVNSVLACRDEIVGSTDERVVMMICRP